MKTGTEHRIRCAVAFLWITGLVSVFGGIPEPGLTLYGVVRNDLGGASVRMTSGILDWTITPSGGLPITVHVALTNINDQFSYVIMIPFETLLSGMTLSPGTLDLTAVPTDYRRVPVTIDGSTATIMPPAGTNFIFSQSERGRVERVDLMIAKSYPDDDRDGLPDFWEKEHFGSNSAADPNADPDGDGMNNRREYLAGTDPNDPASAFDFIDTQRQSTNSIAITWSSISNRNYSIYRSTSLLSGFLLIQSGISATPPVNTYIDSNVGGSQVFYYRIRVE